MKLILKTNRGRLTKQALLVGYKEQHIFTYNRTKELYIHSNLIHVRHYNIPNHPAIFTIFKLNELGKARKYYDSIY